MLQSEITNSMTSLGASRLRRVIESLESMPSFDCKLVKEAIKTISADQHGLGVAAA